jgi:hypothetical protein
MVESGLMKLETGLINSQGLHSHRTRSMRQCIKREAYETLRARAKKLHGDALLTLMASDSRLGRAYALGHELSEISLDCKSEEDLTAAFSAKVVTAKDHLADLASSFPSHAGRAVLLSLQTWETWAASPMLDGDDLDWKKDGAGVTVALARQGELWRDLLTGDKVGQDMLDMHHYAQAVKSMLTKAIRDARRSLAPLLFVLILPTFIVIAGIVIILRGNSQTLGAVVAAGGAILGGASFRARVGVLSTHLQDHLWGAALDEAIGEAVLVGPEKWGQTVASVPASGAPPKASANLERLTEFQRAVARGSVRKLEKLIAPGATFMPCDDPLGQPVEDVATWLLGLPAINRIARTPDETKSPWPSVLVSHRTKDEKDGIDVWWIQEGKIRFWREFTKKDDADEIAFLLAKGDLKRARRC